MLNRLFLAALVVATGALTACGGGSSSTVRSAPAPLPTPEDYLIGPGDSLQIFVWDHADLSTVVQVRPDGKISTPLVEDLAAAGKPPTALARDVEKVLSQYVRSPVVTVIVQGFVGATNQQVRVVGEAAAPKALQFRQGMTVLDVIIDVGGLSQFAAGNRSRIVRTVNGRQSEIRVRLEDLLNNGKIQENIAIVPGDVLIIPRSVL